MEDEDGEGCEDNSCGEDGCMALEVLEVGKEAGVVLVLLEAIGRSV